MAEFLVDHGMAAMVVMPVARRRAVVDVNFIFVQILIDVDVLVLLF